MSRSFPETPIIYSARRRAGQAAVPREPDGSAPGSAETVGSPHSTWYVFAVERLVSVVQQLSQARDLDAVTAIVRDAARSLTGADGATFVLRDGDQCYYAEENAIAPLWKGRRFPMSACISGWVMLNARPALIEDIYADPRIPAEAYRPTFVKSLAMVPIRRTSPIGAIGNYWADKRKPSQEEVKILQALADTTSVALENSELFHRLQEQVRTLAAQESCIHEQRDALAVFTRALAHDLREPVRSLVAFSRLIDDDGDAQQKRSYLEFIQRAADRMGVLVDSVFDFLQLDDHPSDPRGATCPAQEVFETVKQKLTHRAPQAVIDARDLPEVQVAPARLGQVLEHLIGNALQHNDGAVSVRVSAEAQARGWLFRVEDDGKGIAPDQAEKIFLPFKRLTHDQQRAGLGLAICRKIVGHWGGDIRCEPRGGRGAVFGFTVPGREGA